MDTVQKQQILPIETLQYECSNPSVKISASSVRWTLHKLLIADTFIQKNPVANSSSFHETSQM